MCSRMCYIGVPVNFEGLLAKHDSLNAQVERDYLRGQKKMFKKMIVSLELQISAVDRTRRLLNNDVMRKEKSMTLDEKCLCLGAPTVDTGCECTKTRKRT
ncbi:hypothetical protein JYU34_010295 [Plutella xylostella]|uniref:Uncharacterized protein n=1 Tax=Plutella xylostella TaxID=51655 RepID=A0ABQ7QI80_PLUXY|nr:hypothetical protein JYU34_010295 [Plutella xylostella]